MLCPNCGSNDKAAVKETRRMSDGGIRRRRRCQKCFNDFETLENVSGRNLRVIKSDGSTELFDKEKIRKGIVKAAVRPHHSDRLTEVVESITREAQRASDAGAVSSAIIGENVLSHLQSFDPVTHVRYALTQLGRQDKAGVLGWRDARDFRNWLRETYGSEIGHAHLPAKIAQVVKRDGRREPFDSRKLERSIGVASKGRGSQESVRDLATEVARDVEHELSEQAIVTSGQLAAEIIRALRDRDSIAAIRFASTAKGFLSVEDYESEALGLRAFHHK